MPPAKPAPTPAPGFRAGLAAELALFRTPRVLLAALALVLVPALYVVIYVSSVWDPYGNLARLPVALVNEDQPATRAGREIALGRELAATLERQRPFGFVRFASPEAARAAVRRGEVFFALLIPPDFSARAAAGNQAAPLGIFVSEGGNYTASILSRRFGAELAHTLNEQAGRERWAALIGDPARPDEVPLGAGLAALRDGGRRVADGAGRAHEGATRLQAGADQLAAGGTTLDEGLAQFSAGSAQLTAGMKQVAEAVATIRAKLPPPERLAELSAGSTTLARGAAELKDGLAQVQDGVKRLDAGVGQFQEEAGKVPFVGGKISAGAGQLRDGVRELGAGVDRAAAGATQLRDGTARLDAGVQPLTAGLGELNAGLGTLASRLPPPAQLALADDAMAQLRAGGGTLAAGTRELKAGVAELAGGARELRDGARELSAGLDEAAGKFAAGFGGATAARLAAPAEASVEAFAPVPGNGPAFAPYFAALALWIGAVMMSFVFFLRRLPDTLQAASRPARWLAKAAPLLALGALQAAIVVAAMRFLLGIALAQPALVWLVATIGSAAFVSVVLFLITLLGDAGRLLAVVLLIFQLAASGGIYPVELSAEIYQRAHGWLPFTFLLRAFRATMFGAFEGQWHAPALALGGCALGAMLLGVLLARWKFVPRATYGPAVEF